MTVAENLRKICAAARPAIEAALDAAEELSEIREAASEQGLDWSQVKALLKAQIQDERDGGERVKKLVAKAENAAAYAVMLEKPAYVEGPNVVEKKKTLPQSKVSRNWVPAQPIRKSQLAASTSSPPIRGDEAAPRVPSGVASPNSDESRANARDEAMPQDSPQGVGKVERASRLVTGRTVAPGRDGRTPAPISEAAPSHSGEIEPARETGFSAGSPISWIDPDPSDIRNMPFYRGGQEWPR